MGSPAAFGSEGLGHERVTDHRSSSLCIFALVLDIDRLDSGSSSSPSRGRGRGRGGGRGCCRLLGRVCQAAQCAEVGMVEEESWHRGSYHASAGPVTMMLCRAICSRAPSHSLPYLFPISHDLAAQSRAGPTPSHRGRRRLPGHQPGTGGRSSAWHHPCARGGPRLPGPPDQARVPGRQSWRPADVMGGHGRCSRRWSQSCVNVPCSPGTCSVRRPCEACPRGVPGTPCAADTGR